MLDFEYCRSPEIFNHEIERETEDSILTPKFIQSTVSSYFPTLLHLRSSACVFILAPRDSFSSLST
jgi:hypothetical protein